MIAKKLEFGPFAANCYVVGDEATKEGIVIDPGAGASHILDEVRASELKIRYIVLTHGHPDHTSALKEVKEATGAEVAIHSGDAMFLQRSLGPRGGSVAPPFQREASAPDRLLQDGDTLEIGDLCFSVIHTPGHTPGGICLLVGEILFSGDTLFNYSIGRSDLPGGNGQQLINSIFTKLMVLPDRTAVCPGHGTETTIGAERRGNPFLRG